MKRTIALILDGFARQTVEATARTRQIAPAELVAEAATYFLADLRQGRPARLVPDFALREGEQLVLELELPEETWTALDEEADAQRIAPELLLVHATLYLIADLNAGRAVSA
jgi:hypothetical protein